MPRGALHSSLDKVGSSAHYILAHVKSCPQTMLHHIY